MAPIFRFGLLYGLALAIGFYASHILVGTTPENFTLGKIIGYSIMIISSLAVVMGILDFNQKRAPVPLGFMSGLGVGLGISLVASHIFAFYNWLYLKFINPTYTATYLQYSEQQIRSSAVEPIFMEKQLAELADYAELMSNNFTQSMLMFATVFMIGLLFSVVGALALRTPRK